jgi:hypothetical protein
VRTCREDIDKVKKLYIDFIQKFLYAQVFYQTLGP